MPTFRDLFGEEFVPENYANDEFEALPAGWYLAQLESLEAKSTRSGGEMLKGTFTILDQKYVNRKIFANFNIRNANLEAVRIGLRELGHLCMACGKPGADSTDDLVGCTCEIRLTQRNDPQYGVQNDVKDYRAPRGNAMPVQQAAAPEQAAPAAKPVPSKSAPRPWEGK